MLATPAPNQALADRDGTIGEWLKDCLLADPNDSAFNRLVGTIRQRSNTSTSSGSSTDPAPSALGVLLREPTTGFQDCCSKTCCSNLDDNEIHLRREDELMVFEAHYSSTLSDATEAASEASAI